MYLINENNGLKHAVLRYSWYKWIKQFGNEFSLTPKCRSEEPDTTTGFIMIKTRAAFLILRVHIKVSLSFSPPSSSL